MTINKGIQVLFTMLVVSGVGAAIALFAKSKTNSEENKNENGKGKENENENENKNVNVNVNRKEKEKEKDIINIKNLFKKYEEDNQFDRNDDDHRDLIKYYEENLTEIISNIKNEKINYKKAKKQVDKIFNNYIENKRSNSIASDDSDDSDVSLTSISGGKKIKRHKKNRSKKTKRAKSKSKRSKFKPKIYKKLI